MINEPIKVKFRKLPNGKIYLSGGYYLDEKDFQERNPTLIFEELTTKTKPEPKEKEKV